MWPVAQLARRVGRAERGVDGDGVAGAGRQLDREPQAVDSEAHLDRATVAVPRCVRRDAHHRDAVRVDDDDVRAVARERVARRQIQVVGELGRPRQVVQHLEGRALVEEQRVADPHRAAFDARGRRGADDAEREPGEAHRSARVDGGDGARGRDGERVSLCARRPLRASEQRLGGRGQRPLPRRRRRRRVRGTAEDGEDERQSATRSHGPRAYKFSPSFKRSTSPDTPVWRCRPSSASAL